MSQCLIFEQTDKTAISPVREDEGERLSADLSRKTVDENRNWFFIGFVVPLSRWAGSAYRVWNSL